MEKNLNVKAITEIAIFSALGFVLDLLQQTLFSGPFINGGSIGIAMIPIIIIGCRRGFIPAFLTGLIMGLTQMLGGIYTISDTWYKVFLQVALDYWLAYPLVAVAAFFKNKSTGMVILGTTVGGLAKYLCHFLSGILFWPSDLWNVGGPVVFSLLYNGSYMIPSIIITVIIMIILFKKYKKFLVL